MLRLLSPGLSDTFEYTLSRPSKRSAHLTGATLHTEAGVDYTGTFVAIPAMVAPDIGTRVGPALPTDTDLFVVTIYLRARIGHALPVKTAHFPRAA